MDTRAPAHWRRTQCDDVLWTIGRYLCEVGNPPTLVEAAEQLGCSSGTISSRLMELVESGLLVRVGKRSLRDSRHWIPSPAGWQRLFALGAVVLCSSCQRPRSAA